MVKVDEKAMEVEKIEDMMTDEIVIETITEVETEIIVIEIVLRREIKINLITNEKVVGMTAATTSTIAMTVAGEFLNV